MWTYEDYGLPGWAEFLSHPSTELCQTGIKEKVSTPSRSRSKGNLDIQVRHVQSAVYKPRPTCPCQINLSIPDNFTTILFRQKAQAYQALPSPTQSLVQPSIKHSSHYPDQLQTHSLNIQHTPSSFQFSLIIIKSTSPSNHHLQLHQLPTTNSSSWLPLGSLTPGPHPA